jgi:hypothetical protein
MKNFLYREDHAPVCPAFSDYFKVYVNLQQRISVAQPVQQHSIKCLESSMLLVFFMCHDKILYRNKIKSPE